MRSLAMKLYGWPAWALLCLPAVAIMAWTVFAYVTRTGKKFRWIMNAVGVFGALAVILIMTIYARTSDTEYMVNLVPFHSFIDVKVHPDYYREMLMNVFLFVPFGLTLPFVFPSRIRHPVRWAILFAAGVSVGIETIQFVFRLGFAETDDVIMNTLGAAIGSLAFVISTVWETRRGPCEKSDP